MALWEKLVSNFTERGLSYATDRLPGMAGLAALIQKQVHDEYLYGIWQQNATNNYSS
jgi:hypothetical protein